MTYSRIDIIGGPTASGKSALAVARARETGGVIINADSMQIYGALPMLTAQPDESDRAAAPHRLYGVLHPGEACSAQRWRELAVGEIERALAEGRRPIIVGGTGLYINTLVNGLSPMPDVPPYVRAETMALQATLGNPGFHAALKAIDSVMAARLHPNDTQRLVRAYEVLQATGQSLDHWQSLPREAAPASWQFHITLVLPERGTLYDRCNMRFEAMLENGVLDEVAAFNARADVPEGALVRHALGFEQLSAYLRGEMELPTATTLAQIDTRQYARRQNTWFNNQIRVGGAVAELVRVS